MNFETVKSVGENIRVHGNGFIQIDLPGKTRLHVWGHRDIPRQVRSSQIHDHRFGFTSKVLYGALVNVTYQTLPPSNQVSATHHIFTPSLRVGEDTILSDSGDTLFIRTLTTVLIERGASYLMRPGIFHETFVNQPTVTMMQKIEDHPTTTPRVLVPIGSEPDNDFQRYHMSERKLWSIVADCMC